MEKQITHKTCNDKQLYGIILLFNNHDIVQNVNVINLYALTFYSHLCIFFHLKKTALTIV